MKKILAKFIWRHPFAAGVLSALCAIACPIACSSADLYAVLLQSKPLNPNFFLAGILAGILLFALSAALMFIKPEEN